MEGGAFLDERIQKEFGRFVEIRMHNDHADTEIATTNKLRQTKRHKTVGMPYYVLTDSTGKTIYWKDGGVISADRFLEALKSVPQISASE